MDYIIGTVLLVSIVVCDIFLIRLVYVNTSRTVLTWSCIACLLLPSFINPDVSSMPKLTATIVISFLSVFIFYGVIGILVAIFGYGGKKKRRVNGNAGKAIGTIILVVIGVLCAGTGVLSPITFACGSMIKTMWKE